MANCVNCGTSITDGYFVCSMCYGDIEYGSDDSYQRWAEQPDAMNNLNDLSQRIERSSLRDKIEMLRPETPIMIRATGLTSLVWPDVYITAQELQDLVRYKNAQTT